MAINYSDYVYNVSSPSAPRINNNINETKTSAISDSVSTYNESALNYANFFLDSANFRDYVEDKLMKDSCDDVGIAKINKATNKYIASIKADNYFDQAKGSTIITSASRVESIYTKLVQLKDSLFEDENEEGVLYSGQWIVTKSLPETTYDTKAIVVSSAVLTQETSDVFFLKDIANKQGDNRTYSSYITETSSSSSDSSSTIQEQYVVKYTLKKEDNLWKIKNEDDTVIKTTSNIDTVPIVWIDPTE